ncbi:hypothetical protein QJS10_CPA01g02719 [Acorus calamus]|uniref:Uncharacterized protein n=1 Tax=Acorus calamus TaxID=4465 RepID=A0AAV9FMZ4_ACOCL|nr:hypothetical protein QJS10_CPA01g02719 [Acorus calamus]
MASSFSEFQEYMVTVGGKNFWTTHAFGKDSGFDAVFATKFDSCDYRMLNGGNHNQNSMGSMGRYTNPLKEFLKHSMLQHEAIFKEQVYELHRLYWTQKNLMNIHNLKENCTAWNMGPQLSSVSLQNERRDSQSEGVNFIPPLNPMMSTVQADSRIMVEHCQGSSSTLHQSRRRRVAIDLELPGEDYISDDEFTKDQKQGEVQNPAQHEMVVLPENMKVRLNCNEKICADETTVRINLFNQGFSLADRGAINLEEYAEEAKMVASFDLEAPPACQGGIHGLVQHALHDTRREDLDSMSLMKCSTMDQSERMQGKISYHYDSECNISSGSHDDKLFTQKKNTNQSCRALLDLNESLPDESSIIIPATIGHPSPSESSSGHGRSVSVESHFHFQPVTAFLGIQSSTCSKETPWCKIMRFILVQ